MTREKLEVTIRSQDVLLHHVADAEEFFVDLDKKKVKPGWSCCILKLNVLSCLCFKTNFLPLLSELRISKSPLARNNLWTCYECTQSSHFPLVHPDKRWGDVSRRRVLGRILRLHENMQIEVPLDKGGSRQGPSNSWTLHLIAVALLSRLRCPPQMSMPSEPIVPSWNTESCTFKF